MKRKGEEKMRCTADNKKEEENNNEREVEEKDH